MNYKLLIVDDEPGIRDSLREYFEMQDFSTDVADCGEVALEMARSHDYDLILSDVRMPRGDGGYLLKKIREKHDNRPYFIMMSGFTDLTVEQACAGGAVALMTKPINPTEALRIVQRLLQPESSKWQWDTADVTSRRVVSISASDLAEACGKGFASCGHMGIFIESSDMLPKVGENIEVSFSSPRCKVRGQVLWARAHERDSLKRGFGISIHQATSDFLNQFEKIRADLQSIATVPNN